MKKAVGVPLLGCTLVALFTEPAGAAVRHSSPRSLRLGTPKSEPAVSLLSVAATQDGTYGLSPNALQSYCVPSGEEAQNLASQCGLHEGLRVKADWKSYGIYYEATVLKVHTDGSSTVDLLYADGFQEGRVTCDQIEKQHAGPPKFHPDQSDPVCHQNLFTLVEQVQDRVDMAHTEIMEYLHRRSGDATHQYSSFGRRRRSNDLNVKRDGWKHVLDTPQFKSKRMMDDGKEEKEVQKPARAPDACRAVGEQMYQKYGSASEAFKAVDENGDTMATEEEFAHSLEKDLGNSEERSAALARGIIYEAGDRSTRTLTSHAVSDCTNDAAAREVGDQIYEKYGDDEDAILSIDKDADERVTKGELESALVDLGNSQGEAESLALAVMQKYDPESEGSVPASTLVDLADAAGPKKKSKKKRAPEGEQDEPQESEESKEPKKSEEPAKAEADAPTAELLQQHYRGAPGPAPVAASSPAANGPAPPSPAPKRSREELQEAKEQEEDVKRLRKELLGRDRELLTIARRLEDEKDCDGCLGSKKMKSDLSRDKELDGAPIPETSEGRLVEASSLDEKIDDRAERLDELLDAGSLIAAEQWLMTPAEERAADEKVLSDLRLDAHNIRTETEHLLERDLRSEADKPLDPDPELRLQIHRVSRAAFKISRRIDLVATQEEKLIQLMDQTTQKLVEFRSTITGGDDVADNAADNNSELVRALEDLDAEIRTARFETHTFESDLLPSERKWWRYRWEFSCVEAQMLMFVCILAMVWESFLWKLKGVLFQAMWRNPSFNRDYHMSVIHSQCAFLAAQEMCNLLLVFITLAVMKRFDVWQYWVDVQYWVAPAMHQPRTADEYNSIATGVTIQLSLAMFFFFWHCFSLVSHSQQTLNECTHLERLSQLHQDDVTPEDRKFSATSRPMVLLRLTTAEDYGDSKRAFLKAVREVPDLQVILAKFVEGKECDDHDFLMWYFIGQNIKSGIEKTARMHYYTWSVLFLTFLVFALATGLLCLSWTWTYAGFAVLLIAADFWIVRSIKNDVDTACEERDEILQKEADASWSIDQTSDVGGVGDEANFEGKAIRLSQFDHVTEAIARLNSDVGLCREGMCIVRSENGRYYLLWRSDRKHEVFAKFGLEANNSGEKQMFTFSMIYQFVLLFLCFGAARLIFCFWMWKYYFWSTLLTVILLVVAICIFQLVTAPWTIAHFVVLSFPPHVSALQDRKTLKLTQRHSLVERALACDGLQFENRSSAS